MLSIVQTRQRKPYRLTDTRCHRHERLTEEERFWRKVEKTDACWLWRGTVKSQGYGMFAVGRKNWAAHRYAYTRFTGAIPTGFDVHHVCLNILCVRPDHLLAVDRSKHKKTFHPGTVPPPVIGTGHRTHCIRGHEFTSENTYFSANGSLNGHRSCKICARMLREARQKAGAK